MGSYGNALAADGRAVGTGHQAAKTHAAEEGVGEAGPATAATRGAGHHVAVEAPAEKNVVGGPINMPAPGQLTHSNFSRKRDGIEEAAS